MLVYHHTRPLESVRYGVVEPGPTELEPEFPELTDAYRWLEEEIGFAPIFLAVGAQEWQLQMTGYQDQWRRWVKTELDGTRMYRRKGEFPNFVLFSFKEKDIKNGVFIDECSWCVFICGAFLNKRPDWITKGQVKSIFKKSWPRSRWLREAKDKDSNLGINLLVPFLDLSKAKRVWVRNKSTKRGLENIGFKNVQVKRLKVPQI